MDATNPNPTTTPKVPRWYLRCGDCLSVIAVDTTNPPGGKPCVCGGRYVALGKVHKASRSAWLETTEHVCPCDGRCTGARGPSCDCSCGGENHGSNLLVEVVVVEGKVPPIQPPDADAVKRAEEYRAEVHAARVRIGNGGRRDAAEQRSRCFVDAVTYRLAREYHELSSQIARAKNLKTHKGRIRALRAIAPDTTPVSTIAC